MLSKGYRPADGYQHKTTVDFMAEAENSITAGSKFVELIKGLIEN